MSIIMARWKWAPAPATAFGRWNVSRRRAVAEAQPQCRAWSILGAARGVRSGTLGRPGQPATALTAPQRMTELYRGAVGQNTAASERGRLPEPSRNGAKGIVSKRRGSLLPGWQPGWQGSTLAPSENPVTRR
jgi:hypothetical protein